MTPPVPRHEFLGKLTDAQPLLGAAPLTASDTGHGAVRAPGYKLSMHFRGRGREWCIVRVVLGCFSAPDVASSPSTLFVMFSLSKRALRASTSYVCERITQIHLPVQCAALRSAGVEG